MVVSYICFNFLKPITIYCDNEGEIVLAKNAEGKRTKYLDIKYHFVEDKVKENYFAVKFIPSDKNKYDTYTKKCATNIITNTSIIWNKHLPNLPKEIIQGRCQNSRSLFQADHFRNLFIATFFHI